MKEKKIPREELKTFVDNLTLSDDAAFAIGFDDNVSGVQFLVSTITERKDIRVESARAQVSVRVVNGHSVTFDILARDRSGALIDIEMQKMHGVSRKEFGQRMEYYSSVLAWKALLRGEGYTSMRERIVIFIVDSDIFGKGKAVYRFRTREDDGFGLVDDTGCTMYVANMAYRGRIREDLRAFYADLAKREIEEMECPDMREALWRVKGNEERRMEAYNILGDFGVKLYDEGIEKGKEEGLERGKAEGRNDEKAEIARKMMKLNYPISAITDLTGFTIDEITDIASKPEQ